MFNKVKVYLSITALTVLSTFIFWTPFIFNFSNIGTIKIEQPGFSNILKNWDGPLYVIPAKTLYQKDDPLFKENVLGLERKYFAAHIPFYPLTIRVLSPIFGYINSTVVSTLLFSILLFCFFYFFVKKLKLTEHPFFLTLVFMFVTPRFFIVRNVGSPEPMFLLFILMSIYFFIEKRFWLSGLLGGLATMTKSPGILLTFGYGLFILEEIYRTRKINWNYLGIILIPGGLLAICIIYYFQLGDFFAYFNSGDNIHLVFPPFSVFNQEAHWVGTAWLEEIVYLYFFYLAAIFKIKDIKELRQSFYFMVVFFLAIISVQHRDISRYSLPLLPFSLIAFENFFTSKKFLFVLLLLLPAIYFYGWNMALHNVAPITDWKPFL